MDLHEMLRVDRCRNMDKLINFWVRDVVHSDGITENTYMGNTTIKLVEKIIKHDRHPTQPDILSPPLL